MIQYGIACLLVCFLTLPDKRAMSFALTILAGWSSAYLVGYIDPERAWMTWPVISAASGIVLYHLSRKHRFWWSLPVAALAGSMLLLDGLYVVCRSANIQIEVEYSRALDLALIAQLSLIGFGGLRSGWAGFLDKLRDRLRVGHRLSHARESTEGKG